MKRNVIILAKVTVIQLTKWYIMYLSIWFYCLSLCGLVLFASFREFGSVKFFFFGFWLGLVFRNYCSGTCVLDSSNSREGAVDLLNRVKGPSCSMNFVRNYLISLLPTANFWMPSVVTAAGNKNIRRKMFGKSCGRTNRKREKGFCHPLLLRCYLLEENNTIRFLFMYQLMHKRISLKRILKFTLKQLRHVSV
jgi:hypothetical protein